MTLLCHVQPAAAKADFFLFSPPLGLLPVLGPLGNGTDATHQPSPALRLLGW